MITHPDDEAVERAGILTSVAGKDEVFRDSFVENLAVLTWGEHAASLFVAGVGNECAWTDIWSLLNAPVSELRSAWSRTVEQRSGVGA